MAYKTSKGEQRIINLLRCGKIDFDREVSFKGLNGEKGVPLRFDFVVYQNSKIYCCIDFDGKQHFKFTPFFHKNWSGFEKQKEWDRRKNKFCLMHKIPFIRIPYWDLDKLTLRKIFYTPSYLVTNKYHNDNLIREVKKWE